MVDRRRVFAECVSVLKPGGHLVWLDMVHPIYRKADLRLWGEIGITRSTEPPISHRDVLRTASDRLCRPSHTNHGPLGRTAFTWAVFPLSAASSGPPMLLALSLIACLRRASRHACRVPGGSTAGARLVSAAGAPAFGAVAEGVLIRRGGAHRLLIESERSDESSSAVAMAVANLVMPSESVEPNVASTCGAYPPRCRPSARCVA